MVHPVQLGKATRMSYSKINEVLEMPNLIEIQKNSYQWFLEEGLREVLRDVSPISDYTGNLIMEFIDYSLDENIKYSVEECKERDTTYSAPLKVRVRLINKETGEVKEQEIFMGDFPLMTETGTFVINGAERVIVSQLVRSPGIYYSMDRDKTGKKLYSNTVIPNRGAWLEYETDSNNIVSVRIDRTRKLPITVFLRALGYGTDAQLIQLFGEDEKLLATIQKDNTKSEEEGLLEVYKRLRPGEPPTVESAGTLLNNLFFDPKRYDLSKVGRYKFNKKLALAYRIWGKFAADSIADGQTGEIIVEKGHVITEEAAWKIQNSGVNVVNLDINGKIVRVIGNNTVDIKGYINFDASSVGITEKVRYGILKQILDEYSSDEDIKTAIINKMYIITYPLFTKL
jgi:DNA-directed RNA polymerase subunit beta